MQTVKLVYRASRDPFSRDGLVAEGLRGFLDPAGDGGLLAHDLLEHCNGIEAIGSVHDELMALGGYWYVRGQHDQVSEQYFTSDPKDPLAREVARQVGLTTRASHRGFSSYAERKLPELRLVPNDEVREAPGENDAALREILALADGHTFGFTAYFKERSDDILHYMRKGYRLTAERFPDAKLANKLYWAIRDAAHGACVGARKGVSYELHYGDGKAELVQLTAPAPYETPPEITNLWRQLHTEQTQAAKTATEVDWEQAASLAKKYSAMSTAAYRKSLDGVVIDEFFDIKGFEPKSKKLPPRIKRTGKMHGPAHAQRNVYKEARA